MRILFIDDEQRRMEAITAELELAGHFVVFNDNADAALKSISGVNEHFDLMILDISIPPGKQLDRLATDGGARTGIALFDVIRQTRPRQKVVIFTNISDAKVEAHFANQDSDLCLFIRKSSVLPFEFVERLEAFANR